MKKYSLIFAVIGTLLLYGCANQKPGETEVIPSEQETVSEPTAEEIGGAATPETETDIQETNTFKWDTTTSSLEFEYPASYRDIAVTPLPTKPEITTKISDLLGPNDSLLSINDIYFTDEVIGIELPLRALFVEVASEDTVKKILPTLLSRTQIMPPDVSPNYELGDESIVNLPNLEDPVTKFEVTKDDAAEGNAYLIRVAVEGQTITYAVLFVFGDNELDNLVTSSAKIGMSDAMSQKMGN